MNLYLPSELERKGPSGAVKVVQTTGFSRSRRQHTKPEDRPAVFALKLRVPVWSKGMSIKLKPGRDGGEIRAKPAGSGARDKSRYAQISLAIAVRASRDAETVAAGFQRLTSSTRQLMALDALR